VAEQLARANELLPLSAVTQSGLVASNDAHRLRAVPLFMLGDRTGFEAEVEELARYGEQLRSPYCQGLAVLWRAALAFLDGRFAEVEPLANEALGICSDDANFQNSWAGQMFHLHGETGRLDEIKPLVAAMVDQNPGLAAFRAALAYTHASLGELDDARRHFEVLAADDFDGVPRDLLWPASLGLMSEACVLLDDRIRAGALSGLFRRHAGLLVVAAGGSHCMGAVDRYLGMLASTDRRWAAAEGHFDAALELEEGLGSEPLTARTRHWYGRMLLARDGPGDRSKASELFSRSLETAERLGMEGLVIATRDLASVA
jgi:tetratricopeptide (TPR) repeat protein